MTVGHRTSATGGERDENGLLPQVLLVGSLPLTPPWNQADKNIARLLVEYDDRASYTIQSSNHVGWNSSRPAEIVPTRLKSDTIRFVHRVETLGLVRRAAPRVDLIHVCMTVESRSLLAATTLRWWRRRRYLPVVHTAPSIGDLAIRPSAMLGDITVVFSKSTQQRLIHAGIRNVMHVMPPVDMERLAPTLQPEEIRKELNITGPALLYPGYLGKSSGIPEALQAVSRLPDALRDTVLVVAAKPRRGQDWQTETRRLSDLASRMGIAHRVRILGSVPDIAGLILACDVTVLVPLVLAPKMAIPLVLLESLYLGRPIVVGATEPLHDALLGGAGSSVKEGDIDALTAALERLLTNPAWRSELGCAGRHEVIEKCQPARFAAHYEEIYARALRHRPRPADA